MKHLRALGKYFWKYRVRLLAGIFFVVLSNYFNVLAPQLMRYVINYVDEAISLSGSAATADTKGYAIIVTKIIGFLNQYKSVSKVIIIASLIILATALLRGFFMFLMRQTIIVMSRHIEYDQKNEVYGQYQRLDSNFFKQHATGDLMNRIAEDVSRVRIFTGPAIMYIVNLLTVIILCIFFMMQSSPVLTLYILIPFPILALIIYFVNSNIHKKSERIQAALSDLTTNAQESYSGIRVIKSFVQERSMYSYFLESTEEYRKRSIDLAKLEAIYFPSIQLLIGISTLLTIMIGGLYYINNSHNISLGTIVEFIVYVNMLAFPVMAIGLTASMVQRASASQKRLNEFLDIQPEIFDEPTAHNVVVKGRIDFENVSFTYPDTGIKALDHVHLQIRHGEKIAITGKIGSGKSTIAKLLLRMYNADEGKILIDETPIGDIRLSNLRSQISYVPQEVFLFSDTVENNIRLGRPDADRADIIRAAEMAGVAKEIESFSNGYETMVGERGVTLSGGQKQRISIARALLKNSPIVIFDDSLSAVDAKTEKEIMGQLNSHLINKTAIVITHRVFSLLNFDRIIVLDNGRVAEMGTHEELMQNSQGFYAKLYQRQQFGTQEETLTA